MYKLEMKTKHQNKTQSHKKRKMQQQSTTFSGHHHRQKNKTLAGRPNLTGRPSSPVTIIAKKKKTKPVSSSSPAGQTQPADHHLRSKPSLKNRF
jgi:hypothetical protein